MVDALVASAVLMLLSMLMGGALWIVVVFTTLSGLPTMLIGPGVFLGVWVLVAVTIKSTLD